MRIGKDHFLGAGIIFFGVALLGVIFIACKIQHDDFERERKLIETQGLNKIVDQCLYREAMESCLVRIPQGAASLTASGNDWDEVVAACADYSRESSYRTAKYVRVTCR
jgi:hypothetical protein